MPAVSVIIPAYNAEAFVEEAVRSVFAQTYRDFEIIVVDDGSTDGTPDVVRSLEGSVRLIRQRNQGLPAARNAGAAAATGEWLAFLDADDIWLPDKLERQMRRADGSVVLIYTDRYNFGARGDLPEVQGLVTPLLEGEIFESLLYFGNFITASSVLIQRRVFNGLGGFYEKLKAAEDWDLWIRCAATSLAGVCREPLLRYRFHTANMSRDGSVMSAARACVLQRAFELPRSSSLSWIDKRIIHSRVFSVNGSEAARYGVPVRAIGHYARSALAWPFQVEAYKEALRACIALLRGGKLAA
jgi:glycosyltransferase involved in cell wall biosynthesis